MDRTKDILLYFSISERIYKTRIFLSIISSLQMKLFKIKKHHNPFSFFLFSLRYTSKTNGQSPYHSVEQPTLLDVKK